jgi:ABC-2 type transport system ATP-binding protein
LLLLDEPTVGVDPLSRRELWEIIRQLIKEGLTVLLSSSDPDEAETCDSVLVLSEGKKLMDAPPAEVSRLALGRTFLAHAARGHQGAGFTGAAAGSCPTSSMRCRSAAGPPGRVKAIRPADPTPVFAGVAAAPDAGPIRGWIHGAAAPSRRRACRRKDERPACSQEPAISGAAGDTVVEVHDLVRRFGKIRRGRSREFRRQARRDLRSARSQRRRQDHDVSHALRTAAEPPRAV